jgi:hypothetical protein
MMKPNDNPRRRCADLVSCALGILMSFAVVPHLRAQSADIFKAKTNGSGADGSADSATEVAPEPVDDTPSRFAGRDLKAYTASRAAVFSMRNRVTDPFGFHQDPDVKPIVKKATANSPAKRQAALPPTPLSEIVELIRVTTIMPGERKFLVGMRSFSESDEFSLIFQGKKMNMKVVEVSAQNIIFRNLENGETASLKTKMLPPGMAAGGDGLRPPGMISPLDDIPLELGSGTSPEPMNDQPKSLYSQ